MQGKVAAERAVRADNDGNAEQALRLYRLTVKLLHEGCELEQDPDAIVTLRGKVASFKRRIAELEGEEADWVQEQQARAAEVSGSTEWEDEGQGSGAMDEDGDAENDGVTLDELHRIEDEDEDEDSRAAAAGVPRAAWSEDPNTASASGKSWAARHKYAPSAQLSASQEGLQHLLQSKDRLEAQIQEARLKAETYTRALEEARRLAGAAMGTAGGGGGGGGASVRDDSSLASADTDTDNNTNIAITQGVPQAPPRVLALERLVKVLQRELIVANTDLRVSQARSAALTQKLAEGLGSAGAEAAAKQLSAADLFVSSMREALVELEASRQEAQGLGRSLAAQLATSKLRCSDLENELAILQINGVDPVSTPTYSSEYDGVVTGARPPAKRGGRMLISSDIAVAEPHTSSLSGASSITTDASASVSIMRRWKSQAQDRLAIKARVPTGSKHASGSRSPNAGAQSPKTSMSPKVSLADREMHKEQRERERTRSNDGNFNLSNLSHSKPGQLGMRVSSSDAEENSFEDTKGMLRDSYQLAARGLGRGAGGEAEGATEDILLMHSTDRDRDRDSAVKRPAPARKGASIVTKREKENVVKARLEASIARGAAKATSSWGKGSAAAVADIAAARGRAAAQKSREAMQAKRAAQYAATLQAAKTQLAADARAKLIKARVQAHNAASRGGTLAKRLSSSNPIGTPPRRTQVKVVVPSQRANTSTASTARSKTSATGRAGSARRSASAPSASLLAGIGVERDFHLLNLSLDSAEGGLDDDDTVRLLSGRR